ncbi:MAG: MerR family transcriptional regulator [Fimbriimonadaceae bacterium]|nr:MerR family transcriptional regulator [Fimbriimonadaceae bacterium]
MERREADRPQYVISVAAALVEAHPQTLRMYERTGLLQPQRSGGNLRLYSERDLQRIRRIQSYTAMGVNLAGIEVIFRLLERIEALEAQLEQQQAGQRRRTEEAAVAALRASLRQPPS